MGRLQSLSARERLLLTMLGPLIALAAAFQFLWLPLQAQRTALLAEIAAYTQISAQIARLPATGGTVVAAAPRPTTPLPARVTQSAADAGLTLRRLEPEGDSLRVTLDDVAFASVVLWLSDLEVTQGVTLSAIELDRRTEPGIVSARLLLKGAP
jgi:general secretion pathway protein M